MACLNDDDPPPYQLQIAWQCEQWHSLPITGGLYDQDYRLMHEMNACLNIYRALDHMQNSHGAEIHSLSETERKILGELVRMGLLFNA